MNLYREVLDNIPTAAIVVDKKMRVRYTNTRSSFPFASAEGDAQGDDGLYVGGRVRRRGTVRLLSHAFALSMP